MSSMAVEVPSGKMTLKSRFVKVFIPQPLRERNRRKSLPPQDLVVDNAGRNVSAALQAHEKLYQDHALVDKQTGERKDHTAMLHSLVHTDSYDGTAVLVHNHVNKTRPGNAMFASLPTDIWQLIVSYLTPSDAASLALSTKTLAGYLGPDAWEVLKRPENQHYQTEFLLRRDEYLPDHLFCFLCKRYHVRKHKGHEVLKMLNVSNPLYDCPNAYNNLLKQPRIRVTPGRTIPFQFLQLAQRSVRHSKDHGIPPDALSRRWKQGDWMHMSKVSSINGHIYLRVVSTAYVAPAMTPAALRMLLYSREDYTPYFSACAHWQDGVLMELCKCAIGHIPEPRFDAGPEGLGYKIKDKWMGRQYSASIGLVTLCNECRPMRRCPECPTEYLIEIRLAEDKTDNSFKRAIVVTRWSDLGDAVSPASSEWAACLGELKGYDSFAATGRRAIAGTFESNYTEEHIPGARMLSLNPKGKKDGEEGDKWY